MQSLLEDKDEWLNENSGLPDDILISGGGDDIVGDQFIGFGLPWHDRNWRVEEHP
jgi:hypothetical protein